MGKKTFLFENKEGFLLTSSEHDFSLMSTVPRVGETVIDDVFFGLYTEARRGEGIVTRIEHDYKSNIVFVHVLLKNFN
jgi:hypothetical protein